AIAGPAGWAPASGSFTSATAFTITWPGRGTYSATVGTDQVTWNNGITWRRGGSGGAGGFGTAGPGPSAGTAVAGGICANPRTQAMMDEWLARAIPPQPAGSALRYEPWGRLVGRSLTANVTVNGAPDTRLTRCEWLWNNAAQLRSANGLGTLKEYVESRR
ncbi:MAG: hypothetical protein JNK87_34560, partial [Bryobacterales bacterium]|nr:hypothetical protein [Bryobacterales bacterium]